MTYKKSYGAIVYTVEDNVIRYVLVWQKEGFWGFPKGHIKVFETEEGCALRIIGEEVGLSAFLLTGFREVDEHPDPDGNIIRQHIYLCASYNNQEIKMPDDTLLDTRLVTFDEAVELLKETEAPAERCQPCLELLEKADAFIKKEMQLKKDAREHLCESISRHIPLDQLGEPVALTGTDRPHPNHEEFCRKLTEMMLTDDGDEYD